MSIELIHLLILVITANASPILLRKLLNDRFNYAVDGNKLFPDGYRILGESVTWRGIIIAIIMTSMVALLLSYSWVIGLLVGVYAMLGDMIASFIKRRLGMASSSMAPLLDQIPESLLPALMLQYQFGLDGRSVVILVVLFIVLELMLSYIFYKLGVRRHPY